MKIQMWQLKLSTLLVETICPAVGIPIEDPAEKRQDSKLTAINLQRGKKLPVYLKINKRCFILFPCMFVLWNSIYWPKLACK